MKIKAHQTTTIFIPLAILMDQGGGEELIVSALNILTEMLSMLDEPTPVAMGVINEEEIALTFETQTQARVVANYLVDERNIARALISLILKQPHTSEKIEPDDIPF